ncbi:MAG: VIT family Fe(2+)/Mn(2+) transporter [Idiomarinaceae bacterium HL-53]|nr:MAG: VIT family Fe(2+)/Mn(2+) transporter [Idiomarinaceae bacterium HL-53]CUS49167.1 Predicted Fe2+/Mn2+ transporter, VIT1/CCC1 family [Idiomarinaceae bacterium HL-53]
MEAPHQEKHRSHRAGWLRAAVLGANDGLVSTASLVIGVAAASASKEAVLLAAVAGWAAGAMSMAAGEYVSVQSQADTELADLEIENRSLKENPEAEHRELSNIYQQRGLSQELADKVAQELMAHDALAAHARDDIGITEVSVARPFQAAVTSALLFSLGAWLPIVALLLSELQHVITAVASSTIIGLFILGATAGRLGGASIIRGGLRIAFWGVLAMVVTAFIGKLVGVAV